MKPRQDHRQLSLFDAPPARQDPPAPGANQASVIALDPDQFDDAALVTAFRSSTLAETVQLAAAVAARRPPRAMEAALHVWNRFVGFGDVIPLPEQRAVLDLVTALGARDLLRRILDRGGVPAGLRAEFLHAAAACAIPLDPELVRAGLRDRDPSLRAAALQIALPSNLDLDELTPLLQDRDPGVRDMAAVTLAEAGVEAARTPLLHSLRTRPTRRGLEALALYQDAEALVRLGQLARARPALVAMIRPLIEEFEDPRVGPILASLPPSPDTEEGAS